MSEKLDILNEYIYNIKPNTLGQFRLKLGIIWHGSSEASP